jgi:N-acetylglucosaminyldiphosphoundecaprenol N-acetyl-beta-D-mannosaminyltransferase
VEEEMSRALSGGRFVRIATVNPEFLVRATRDAAFRKNLLSADLRIPDGFGLVVAGMFSGRHLSRYPGADLAESILRRAESEGRTVFFAVGRRGFSSFPELRDALGTRFPNIRLSGAELDPDKTDVPEEARTADIVFCGFGAPRQEYFLESIRKDPGNVRIAVGIGGAVDFLSEKRRRAPRAMRQLGLEWLFRLVVSPHRFGRIVSAVLVFPFLYLFDRIRARGRGGRRKSENEVL